MKKIITSFFVLSFFIVGPVLANVTPNDPFFSSQWYLSKIKADSAWDKTSDSPDTVIAVIDSGVQINHPDLKDNIWHNEKEIAGDNKDNDGNGFIDDVAGWDFSNNVPDPSPKFTPGWTESGVSHGTMIAGIIAATGNNNIGVTGLTWRAKIMPLKALNDKGDGKISDVIRAIDYAVNNGADIINLSFVGFSYNEGLQDAIYRAHKAGVIVVAAAGNEQTIGEGYNIDKTPIYPACYDGKLIGENMVIGVAATDALDQKAKFSSYGFSCVDISAPGISFFNTSTYGSDLQNPESYYNGYWSGTSMATPLVSGTLALISQANPELSRREIVNILFASTDNISRLNPAYLGQLGNGRLNVDRAVEMAKQKLYDHVSRLLILPVNGSQEFKMTAANGQKISEFNLSDIKNAYKIASGDVNNDGNDEIILAAGPNQAPEIQILDKQGKLINKFLAYDSKFRGGISLAVADIDGNGYSDILVASASAGSSEIKIFDYKGRLQKSFYAVSKNWRGGLNLAVGDIDGRGNQEIVVSYGAGSEPRVLIFNSDYKLVGTFLAYEKKFRGGVNLVVANIDGRRDHNKSEIIVSPGKGREPLIKIFDHHSILKKQFLAYGQNWQGGVNLTAGDINNDGISEIVTGAYPGAAPHVRIFNNNGTLLESFYAYPESFNGGVNIGIMNINN